MIKKLFIFLFLCLFCFNVQAQDWDLLNEDCAGIDDWDDDDVGVAVSEVDPAGQFRMDTNAGAAGNAVARRNRDFGSTPDTFTLDVNLSHDAIGTRLGNDFFGIQCKQADERFDIKFCSDGFFIRDTDDGWREVGADLVKHAGAKEWQNWRFLVTFGAVGDGTCDIYLNDSTHDWAEVATGITCSVEGVNTDGEVRIEQLGHNTDNMVTHIDWINIDSDHFIPGVAAAAQVIRIIEN